MKIDIIALAREAGFDASAGFVLSPHAGHFTGELERFAELVQQATAEACCKAVVERSSAAHSSDFPDSYDFVKAIRAKFGTDTGITKEADHG